MGGCMQGCRHQYQKGYREISTNNRNWSGCLHPRLGTFWTTCCSPLETSAMPPISGQNHPADQPNERQAGLAAACKHGCRSTWLRCLEWPLPVAWTTGTGPTASPVHEPNLCGRVSCHAHHSRTFSKACALKWTQSIGITCLLGCTCLLLVRVACLAYMRARMHINSPRGSGQCVYLHNKLWNTRKQPHHGPLTNHKLCRGQKKLTYTCSTASEGAC